MKALVLHTIATIDLHDGRLRIIENETWSTRQDLRKLRFDLMLLHDKI